MSLTLTESRTERRTSLSLTLTKFWIVIFTERLRLRGPRERERVRVIDWPFQTRGEIVIPETGRYMETHLEPPPLRQDRTWDALCHLLALAGFVGIPFGNIVGPLILWILKKDEVPSVDAHGKESVNFQISMTIYTIAAALSIFIFVGIALLPAVLILNLVLVIIAGVKASQGEAYRYPLSIRFIK